MSKKVLIAGESWMSFTTHVKGFDSFVTSVYEEGVKWIRAAIEEGGYEVDFIPNHLADAQFPFTIEELSRYDTVILSDIGSNTLLLSAQTFTQSIPKPNRCQLIKDYVLAGGSLLMVGGYMTFSGIDGKGRWGQTPVADVLPVQLMVGDDRSEHPEGVTAALTTAHRVLAELPESWPALLGYNKTTLRSDAQLIATINGDPLVALGSYGQGRSAVFTSDCSPHWAPPEFVNWPYYNKLWQGLLAWLNQDK